MLVPSWPANATVSWPLLINVGANSTVATSINKRLCQNRVDDSTIQPTRAGLGRHCLAFAVANCLLNLRFATATVGSCCDGLPARPAIWWEMIFLFELLFFPHNSNKLRSQTESCYFPAQLWGVVYGGLYGQSLMVMEKRDTSNDVLEVNAPLQLTHTYSDPFYPCILKFLP